CEASGLSKPPVAASWKMTISLWARASLNQMNKPHFITTQKADEPVGSSAFCVYASSIFGGRKDTSNDISAK
ncbi:MAG: hypothetical protein KDE46_05675, partial [Caldilineaceae bacterium]|nr:hypothetical protein [Caldilineaceae bacterium]